MIAVLGLIPTVESVTRCWSPVRPRLTVSILVLVMLILLIVPRPLHITNRRILNFTHIPIFIFLSIAALQFYALFHWPAWLRITIPLCLLVFVSLATEFIQTVIPGRCTSFGDFKLNVLGIIYGSLLFSLIRKWKRDLI